MAEWPELEGPLTTMASKMFLPGFTTEDIVQEFKVEAYHIAKWYDEDRASFKTIVWKLCFNRRADLIQKYNTKGRAQWKEGLHHLDNVAGDSSFGEGGDSWAVVAVDDFQAAVAERIGNAGRFSQIAQLKSVDKIGKAVMFCLSIGHNINETCEQIRNDLDPEFDRKKFEKVRRMLQKNPEVYSMVTA